MKEREEEDECGNGKFLPCGLQRDEEEVPREMTKEREMKRERG